MATQAPAHQQEEVVAVWFRKGLRLDDNAPLLAAAAEAQGGARVLPFFILDYCPRSEALEDQSRPVGRNRLRFLLESLADLDAQLRKRYGSQLVVLQGGTTETLKAVVEGTFVGLPPIKRLLYEFDSEPFHLGLDEKLKAWKSAGCLGGGGRSVDARSFHAGHTILDLSRLREKILGTADGKKPVYKHPIKTDSIVNIFRGEFGGLDRVPKPEDAPRSLGPLPSGVDLVRHCTVPLLADVLSVGTDQAAAVSSTAHAPPADASAAQFPGGETAALQRLQRTVADRAQWVAEFAKPKTSSTNTPGDWTTPSTTGISPHLAFGTLSPRRVWHEVQSAMDKVKGEKTQPPVSLHGQMLFRELFYVLSFTVENWDRCENNAMCKNIAWDEADESKLEAWRNGQTGYPFIDALMRQLAQTGWMHHLGRHATSCFLTRGDLYQSWTHGRDHFDKYLLDADWALNNGNWLWLAGVAPFSMPYFRVYSPIPGKVSSLNADQTGGFVKFFVPELKNAPASGVLAPRKAPMAKMFQSAGKTDTSSAYPLPIVDHATASKRNLKAFGLSQTSCSSQKVTSGVAIPPHKIQKTR